MITKDNSLVSGLRTALHAILFFALALCWSMAPAKDERPNIVLMLADNVGWGDLGIYGGGILRGAPTPRLDAFAQEGLRLLNFNVEPWCAPSRAALMTGRYPVRVRSAGGPHLPKTEITIAQLLSERGYATALFGKWHLGHEPGLFPTDRGFDEWYGIPDTSHTAGWDTKVQYDPTLAPMQPVLESSKGQTPRQVKVYDPAARRAMDGEATRKAIAFIEKAARANKPFFVYLPFTQTHSPTLPHPDFDGRTGNGNYADALAELDHRAGEILDVLERLGIGKNTIVVWTSDNGPSTYYPHGATGYWRGYIPSALEGAIRAPFMIRWPARIPAGRVNNEIVHIADILPTMASAAGFRVPQDRPIDGVDQLPFFQGTREKSGREGFPVAAEGRLYAYKWRNWKIHYGKQNMLLGIDQDVTPGIYNLLIDPTEEHPMGRESSWLERVVEADLKKLESTLGFKLEPKRAGVL